MLLIKSGLPFVSIFTPTKYLDLDIFKIVLY
jgi:hypothetical protein